MGTAEAALRDGKPQLAVARYHPAMIEGWLLMGNLDLAESRLADAREAFRAASDLAGEDPRVLRALAVAHVAMGENDEAVKILTRMVQKNPKDASLRSELARALTASGRTEEAVGLVEQAHRAAAAAPPPLDTPLSRLGPEERSRIKARATAALARAYLNLGVMQVGGGHFPEAAELFEKAAALDPDFPNVQYSLGVARFNSKQFERAMEPLNRAALQDPSNIPLRRMLAMACLNAKVYDRAVQLLEHDPDLEKDPSLQFAYGTALSNSGRLAEATAIFQRLMARHHDSAELNVVLAQAHAKDGDFDDAVESAKRALELNPAVVEANAVLGGIFLEQGKLDEAEQAYKAELKVQPDDGLTKHNLALVLELAQRPDDALALLRSALLANPHYGDAHYLLGKILLAQGATAEALEHLETALRLGPQDANVHYQLGRAYQKLGRVDEAQKEFEIFRQAKAAKH